MTYTETEAELRANWTERGIPQERQEAIIAQVAAAAQPGAWVGPFKIGESTEDTGRRRAALFEEAEIPFNLVAESAIDGERVQIERDNRRDRAARFEASQMEMAFG